MINKVILIGNLGKDPEIRRTENGVPVGKFSLATSENFKDKAGQWQSVTEWHNVVVWRELAEKAETSLKKGATVFVEGKLVHRTYDDKDGNKRYITEVVANYFRVIVGNRDNTNEPEPKEEPAAGPDEPESDDLPF